MRACALHAPQARLSSRHRVSLLERVSAEAVTVTLHQVTRERMEDRCRGEYERSFLREFHKVMAPGHVPRDRRVGFWQTGPAARTWGPEEPAPLGLNGLSCPGARWRPSSWAPW